MQSGNTSLVAGSVPLQNEIIISMKKMNKILDFDDVTGVLQCESGCVLQNLEEFVNERNRVIPYDLGAKGSCLIGGNLATNAGGLRYIKFGSLHANVLGLEAVLPNGTILNLMSNIRKDNTGYQLQHLFIGKLDLIFNIFLFYFNLFFFLKDPRALWELLPKFQFFVLESLRIS